MPRGCREDERCRPSQRRGSRKHIVADALAEPGVGDDIDLAPKGVAQIHLQAAEIEQTASLVEADEKIDVAPCRCVAAQHRSEDPHVRGAMTIGNPEELLAASTKIGERNGDGARDQLHICMVAPAQDYRKQRRPDVPKGSAAKILRQARLARPGQRRVEQDRVSARRQ